VHRDGAINDEWCYNIHSPPIDMYDAGRKVECESHYIDPVDTPHAADPSHLPI